MDRKVIVCPTDFTAQSEQALRYASSVAFQTHARLLVVHVLSPSQTPAGEAAPRSSPPLPTAVEGESVEYEFIECEGDPCDEILRVAHEAHASQIIMGTVGHQEYNRMAWGPIAERVVDRASCPVTVVKNEGLAPTSGG